MKRYLIFGYERYYPSGGLNDLIGESDELEAVINLATASTFDYVEIYDQEIDDYVWDKDAE